MKHWLRQRSTWLLAGSLVFSPLALANEYNVSFKGTDIQEFINIVGRNLHKTIIVDPSVRGKIDVKSYDALTEKQYYSFFLNVLEVYGFSVIEMKDGVLKVVKAKDAKMSAIPVVGDGDKTYADSVITRVVAVHNVSVKELSPLLRQLVNNAGSGNVVHYDPANIILLTGTSAVVDRLAEIIRRVDQVGNTDVDVVALRNASASEIVRIVDALNKADAKDTPDMLKPKLVADERTNSVLISGEPKVRTRIHNLITQMDVEMATQGNTRVVYLKYAKAKDMVNVLKGVSENMQAQSKNKGTVSVSGGGSTPSSGASSSGSSVANVSTASGDVMIAAHDATNSLVLTAPHDIMKSMLNVISQLDIRRAQVLIEALIVEMNEGDGINLGVQWGSIESGSVIQYGNTGSNIGDVMVGLEEAKDQTATEYYYDSSGTRHSYTTTNSGDYSSLADALSGVEGAAVSIMMGDWTALINAVSTDSQSNILSSPSITVMDNGEASFIVGEEVPVLTGSTSSSNNSNPFQTVDRKEVGIKLKVVPQINEGDSVQLNIEQEVSNVLAADGAVDVRFGKRQLNTTVMVQDGQMLVLGGLIDERTQESESKVPLLGDIPLLGYLFRSTSTKVEKKNLMVFIKPTIIRDGVTADGVTQRKYNYLRAEQLYKAQDNLKLMGDKKPPVMPEFGQDIQHAPEIQAFIDQMESKKE
ncbi:type II secretion system secretin GspD [Vibrio sp.]|uniref:Type II secretion system protein GspD n=1 Tax=Vibrio viridaestus TaxID=2487322 RepID=A0A3N9U105_9VIBR|nr:type II secretion system secretin GspD [Vibrio viridaestus]MDC0610006.1 type II secretion system secretin GspD [Vibrio sp.]RQW61396.1 type II secretion system protein GspD [Vibrio viridaestus]